MNNDKFKEISYTSESETSPVWYFYSEPKSKVSYEYFQMKVNEYISFDRVLLLDPNGILLQTTNKATAIAIAEEIKHLAVEIKVTDNESVVQLMSDPRIDRKLGLRTKRRPWIFDMEGKIGNSEVYDAWPRSSEKEHASISQHKVILEHPDHSEIHNCNINVKGNIVNYRISNKPRLKDKICIEPDQNILKEIKVF